MKKIFFVIIALSLIVLIQPVEGHFYPVPDLYTPNVTLDFCEFYYEEYLLMGGYLLHLQHPQFPKIRSCVGLYEHIVWNVDHPDRDRILIAEIEKIQSETSEYLKIRHLEEFESIPTWIEKDGKLWSDGKINLHTQLGH